MTDPAEIGAGFLANLKLIPEIMAEMDDDEDNIRFYEDEWPTTASKAFAIGQLVPPSMLLCYEGCGPGAFNRMELWHQRFSLILRPKLKASTLWYWIVNGIPAGQPLRMLYVAPHANCYRMEVPVLQRNSLLVGDGAMIDYYEAQIVFPELGDYT